MYQFEVTPNKDIPLTKYELETISIESTEAIVESLKPIEKEWGVSVLLIDKAGQNSISWVASWLGILGAILVILPETSVFGFAVWIIANGLWITYGAQQHHYDLLRMYCIFLVTAVLGFITHCGIL